MGHDIANTLRNVAFFGGMSDPSLESLAALSKPRDFPAGFEIFREHEPASDVYVLVRGQVSLVICAPGVGCRQLMEVGPGDLLGWSALVGRTRLSDTARTVTPATLIAIDGERLLELCRTDLEFGFDFMHRVAQTLAERLTATRLQLMEMSGFRLPEVQIESD
jgi:CRP-like cAMP-binding protein